MKKPAVGETGKLRALTEAPELRAAYGAVFSRGARRQRTDPPALNVKAEALYPGWQEIIERSHHDGVYLRAQVICCAKRIRAHSDLSDFERSHAEVAEAEFNMIFKSAQREGFQIRAAIAQIGPSLRAGAKHGSLSRILGAHARPAWPAD